MEVMVYGLMNEALWRERQRDLLRKGSKVRWDMERRSGLWARAWGWLRRGVTMLGYSDPESSRGARGGAVPAGAEIQEVWRGQQGGAHQVRGGRDQPGNSGGWGPCGRGGGESVERSPWAGDATARAGVDRAGGRGGGRATSVPQGRGRVTQGGAHPGGQEWGRKREAAGRRGV